MPLYVTTAFHTPGTAGDATSTCSTLSTLFVPVVAGRDIDAVVHVPTNGMTNGRWVAPSGATSRRFRLLTSFAVRESCSEVAAPAGSVQQSVARIGDTPSQLNACSRTGAAVVI